MPPSQANTNIFSPGGHFGLLGAYRSVGQHWFLDQFGASQGRSTTAAHAGQASPTSSPHPLNNLVNHDDYQTCSQDGRDKDSPVLSHDFTWLEKVCQISACRCRASALSILKVRVSTNCSVAILAAHCRRDACTTIIRDPNFKH